MDRRKFLAAGGAAAAVAAVSGFGGQYLQNKRFSVNTSSVKLGRPSAKAEPLPKGAEITDIPGLSSFYTPNSQFYRVDTALVVPQVSPQTWQLRIHGMVSNPMTINFDDLMKRPMYDHDITLTCVSENVGGGYIGNARWQGALLADLLKEAGIQPGATQIVMRDANGMNLGVATEPVMDGRASLLAVGMNGQPLPQEHGFPVRVVVPGLYGYVSACKWVVDMQLTTFGAFDAYWTQRGWSQQAPIRDRVPHRHAEGRDRQRGHGDDRRGRVGAAPRHRSRGGRDRWHLASGAAGRSGHDRHLAAVVLPVAGDGGQAHAPGAGHRQDRLRADVRLPPARAERRDRLPHRARHGGLTGRHATDEAM